MTADSDGGAKASTNEGDEIARLLAVPLGDFVEERKRLATSLKNLGRREEAQAIAKLAKPSAALWVVNQLARRERAAIRRLAELTAAMQGPRHTGDDYAGLLAEHRDVLRSLRAAAEHVLVEAKIGVNPALLERITHTLRTGMADDEARAAIENARLLREVGDLDFASLLGAGASAAGLGGAAGRPAAAPRIAKESTRPAPVQPASRAKPPADDTAARERERERDEQQARAREAEALAREQERERARARAAAAREAEQLRAKADASRKRVREEERAVEAARRALADGEARLAKVRGESEELERALEAAQAAARGQAH